jgi:hypothetical protein
MQSKFIIDFDRLITSTTNGYDGSMMNGLQSLDQWRLYFNNPTKGRLGLLNAIQVNTLVIPVLLNVTYTDTTEYRCSSGISIRALRF